eukprot:g36731.t1
MIIQYAPSTFKLSQMNSQHFWNLSTVPPFAGRKIPTPDSTVGTVSFSFLYFGVGRMSQMLETVLAPVRSIWVQLRTLSSQLPRWLCILVFLSFLALGGSRLFFRRQTALLLSKFYACLYSHRRKYKQSQSILPSSPSHISSPSSSISTVTSSISTVTSSKSTVTSPRTQKASGSFVSQRVVQIRNRAESRQRQGFGDYDFWLANRPTSPIKIAGSSPGKMAGKMARRSISPPTAASRPVSRLPASSLSSTMSKSNSTTPHGVSLMTPSEHLRRSSNLGLSSRVSVFSPLSRFAPSEHVRGAQGENGGLTPIKETKTRSCLSTPVKCRLADLLGEDEQARTGGGVEEDVEAGVAIDEQARTGGGVEEDVEAGASSHPGLVRYRVDDITMLEELIEAGMASKLQRVCSLHPSVARLVSQGNGSGEWSKWTAIAYAAAVGKEDMVRLLVKELGANVEDKHAGRTPLFVAVENHHANVAQVLLQELGAMVDARDEREKTALFVAVETNQPEMVKLLVREGAAVEARDNLGRKVLLDEHCAALKEEDPELYEQAVRLKLFDEESTGQDIGVTPLFVAARCGHVDVVRLLVNELGAEVGATDNTGRTPLFAAVEEEASQPLGTCGTSGRLEVIRILVKEGNADVNARDSYGLTCLFLAARAGAIELITLLVQELGADVNAADADENTVLFHAAQDGHAAVVRLLSELGASVDARNRSQATPLFAAAENGQAHVVSLLAHLGASVNARDHNGGSPLFCAARESNMGLVRLLVRELGAEVDAHDDNGFTPLFWAVMSRQAQEMSRLLVKSLGAKVDAVDSAGRTPLSWAAELGRADVVRLLVKELGATVDQKDREGRTPLVWATERGCEGVVKLLVDLGASVGSSALEPGSFQHLE